MAACLEKMYNQNNNPPPISPRISFSNDFVESSNNNNNSSSSHSHHGQFLRSNNYRDAPVSSDFEFSVTNYSMMSADELFSQGRLLPLKERFQKTTLRDELLAGDDDDDNGGFSLRPPKSSSAGRWKGFLGLRKAHIGSRKIDKCEASGDKRSAHSSLHEPKSSSQEMHNDGGSGSKNVEFRF